MVMIWGAEMMLTSLLFCMALMNEAMLGKVTAVSPLPMVMPSPTTPKSGPVGKSLMLVTKLEPVRANTPPRRLPLS
ncbi:MAG: hypothetical protein BWY87_00859 [Deltaproteobacteria bacterium ADurb.Bin510]|nr:MAG: hypothetical protein BWY87_00859 [Deltaproteobacteria bacterium ADurb.Bin510]